ncbi:MAG: glycosyltransferase family 1 protein [Peptococcaceae bacterium]|jgi:glycosyltransferase involved in cell wall biosynthesis|nr:glycosyltransferase family 1 protein [Peptococcaceae bacterium]
MRIAFVSETFLPHTNGVVARLCASIKWLIEQGHDIVVIAPDMQIKEFAGVRIDGVPSHRFFLYPDMPLSLPSQRVGQSIRAFKPDVVHVVNPAILGIAGIYYSSRWRLPLVASFHTNVPRYAEFYHFSFLKPLLWWYFRGLHNRANLNLCTSETIKAELIRRKFRNVEVWQRGVDMDKFGPAFYKAEMRQRLSRGRSETTLLLYVGRLAAEKQIERLRHVLDISNNLSLAIVGDGPHRRQLEHYFRGTNTFFTGLLHGADLAASYACSDVFVFPSTTETLGLVILEAMASGLPVVAADSGPTCEQIINGINGLLYQPSDPDSLTQAILALRNQELRQRLSQNAYAEARRFSWNNQSHQLYNYYQNVVDSFTRGKGILSW